MKHMAIIKGNVYRKVYRFGNEDERLHRSINPDRDVYFLKELIDEKVIWKGELSSPVLKEHEEFYIDDLNLTIIVSSRHNQEDGTFLYSTNHEIETVEDEVTLKSLVEAQEIKEDYKNFRQQSTALQKCLRDLRQNYNLEYSRDKHVKIPHYRGNNGEEMTVQDLVDEILIK